MKSFIREIGILFIMAIATIVILFVVIRVLLALLKDFLWAYL